MCLNDILRDITQRVGRPNPPRPEPGVQQHPQQHYVNYHQQNPIIVPSTGPTFAPSHNTVYSNNNGSGQTAQGPQSFPPDRPTQRPSSSFTWGNLVTTDKRPSPLFARLLDAIFNFADRNHWPQNTEGLEPSKYAFLHEEMGYPLQGNPSKLYLQLATENHFPTPEATRNEALTILYRTFGFRFSIGQGEIPVLSRQGFHSAMLLDTLVDPTGQLSRFNHILSRRHAGILDPETNMPFPLASIPRASFPMGADQQKLLDQRNANSRFNAEFREYMAQLQGMQQQVHFATMNAMTPGYWIYGPYGRYEYHSTGGLNW
ncbi:hypothetical protein ASPWEDRAFT_33473 [Aspergillus wentii DTO 134E9]|uniref:DUF7514 domain-containing protein n=1 Tax=Aspergillus wentii DTO 134E9 TaxID=1073089 RepID=A0A1L9RZ24_ASPWE|nr:uncharacterized protein ASPWEDRAFT_33473 [Aspergillus wentii DTO 134E9]KAI9932587.1 hypothetical protein MW887_008832 [Aspergillus wentii]OJJ40153.1 hypothetical protein ASPWEDRAFT_33473 [Aspergillus wentii DTO 134E9]